MSVQLQPRDVYQISIQEGYNLYSRSVPVLQSCLNEMDSAKGEWTRNLTDLVVSPIGSTEKEEMANEALSKYHTFVKTREYASEVFTTLQKICEDSKRPEINQETYITIIGLGGNAEDLFQKEKALTAINEHMQRLAERTLQVFKNPMEIRLPQVAVPLNNLLLGIRPELPKWSWSLWSTPSLDAAYQEWLKNASDEEKDWKPKFNEKMIESAFIESGDTSFAKLHRALKTLNLTYIDPQTNKCYGINSQKKIEESHSEISFLLDKQSDSSDEPSALSEQDNNLKNTINAKGESSSKNSLEELPSLVVMDPPVVAEVTPKILEKMERIETPKSPQKPLFTTEKKTSPANEPAVRRRRAVGVSNI